MEAGCLRLLLPTYLLLIPFLVSAQDARQQVWNTKHNQNTSLVPEDVVLTSDSCDWVGSGADAAADGRAIVPVYLRCTQGSLRWRYPRNGLRLLLSHPDHEFKGCIRIRRPSRDQPLAGVRVALEELRAQRLQSLFHPHDGASVDRIRCFSSKDREAVLFVESLPSRQSSLTPASSVFEMDYHLEPRATAQEPHDECRPCTDSELIQSFCASEFLVKGRIRTLVQDETLARSVISVDVDSVLRGSGSALPTDARSISLHRDLKCHSRVGSESADFLFMGRWLLGDAVIRCAPKWSEWKHVRHRALQSGSNACRLA